MAEVNIHIRANFCALRNEPNAMSDNFNSRCRYNFLSFTSHSISGITPTFFRRLEFSRSNFFFSHQRKKVDADKNDSIDRF